MNPQSLCYGVLARAKWPGMERFTVRKAFKEAYPTYDHAWFKYSDAELAHWKGQLIQAGQEIAAYKGNEVDGDGPIPWPTNFKHCYRYGQSYSCPFITACHAQSWRVQPAGSTVGGDPTWSATGQRESIERKQPGAIVLSATTMETWLECRERYRRTYVELVTPPKNDALKLGGEFHNELATYYSSLVK
jgi:hypothetical protein